MKHLSIAALAALLTAAVTEFHAPIAAPVSSAPATGLEPGLVHWHADFDAARAASRESGKPVLLFQLLGRLDEALC